MTEGIWSGNLTVDAKVHFLTVGSDDPMVHAKVLEIAKTNGLVPAIPDRDIFRERLNPLDAINDRQVLAAHNQFTAVLVDASRYGGGHVADYSQSEIDFPHAQRFRNALTKEFGSASVYAYTDKIVTISSGHYVRLPEVIQVRPESEQPITLDEHSMWWDDYRNWPDKLGQEPS